MSRQGAVYRRSPGPVSVSARLRLQKASSTIEIGQDRTRTTTGSVNRHSGRLMLSTHLVLTAVLWDIFAAGTYSLAFVTDTSNAPGVLYTVAAAYVAAGGSAEETIVAAPNILLTPGVHYLSLLKDGAAVRFDGTASDETEPSDYLWFNYATFNGAFTTYGLPVKLTGYVATLCGGMRFLPVIA